MDSNLGKILYVVGVTIFFTFLGCWGVLAHQETAQNSIDARFAKKAAKGEMAEVKLGELAQENGASETVKQFGARMVMEHTKSLDQLKQVATHEQITLPKDVDLNDQMAYNTLAKLSGTAFDRAYGRDMVKDHQADIAEFQKETSNGENDTIKDFASQALPTLEDHLQAARDMMHSVYGYRSSSGHSR